MARKVSVTTYISTEDERDWIVKGDVYPGTRGTHDDPPEPDDVEITSVEEDVKSGEIGEKITVSAWCDRYEKDGTVADVEIKLLETYGEDGDCILDEDEYDKDDY